MLVAIGQIIKTWGVRGELKVKSLTDFPERFQSLTSLYLVSPHGEELVCAVRSVRYVGGIPHILLDGYDSPERARVLNGWFLKVPQEQTVPLPEGTWYWFELIGMEVVTESGDVLGSIIDILETGANDVYVVKGGARTRYIPAIRDVIKQVDRTAKRMTIHVLEGLLDL